MPSGAAIGAEDSAEDIAPVDDNDDSERECGLRLHAQALFDKLVETLSPAAQGYARLLFNTHTSTWDVDFMKIANAEMQRLEFSYGFLRTFATIRQTRSDCSTGVFTKISGRRLLGC